jgi:hypothetical protein
LNAFVILSKCDLVDSPLIEHPEKIHSSAEVKRRMRLVIDLSMCGLLPSDVIPIISLAQCGGPNSFVEYICLHALRRVVDQADALLESKHS